MAGPSYVSLPNSVPTSAPSHNVDVASRSQLNGPLRIRNGTPSISSNSTDDQGRHSRYDDDMGPNDYEGVHDNDDDARPNDSPIPDAVPVVRQHF
jgi:hypothetical protein